MTMKDRVKELRRVPASELRANPKNWRRHPPSQEAALRGVLEDIGFADAVIARETDDGLELIDGHLRQEVMGDQVVPVLIVDVTEEEADKMLLTYDPLAMMAHADQDQLLHLLRDTQFESKAVNDMLEAVANGERLPMPDLTEPVDDPGPQIDRADELREKWQTERGQVWEVGRHRLMCGDCTDTDHVSVIMDGVLAQAVITDPPYGINRDGIENDNPDNLSTLFAECLSVMPVKDGIIIVFQSPRLFPVWLDALKVANHRFERCLWSYKTNGIRFPWRGWILKSDVILVSTIGIPAWPDNPPHCHDIYTYVHEFEIEHTGGWHGAVKPLTEIVSLVGHTTGNIYDPFLGSGTTMVAAEQLGRICYGMEIEPKYVAVTLERMSGMGLEPKLVGR